MEKYFQVAVLGLTNKKRSLGCLFVNSYCESINYDKDIQKLVKGYYSNIRKAFLKRMKDAEKAGQLGKDVSADLATDILMNLLSGLRVHSREGKAGKQLAAITDFTIKSLR